MFPKIIVLILLIPTILSENIDLARVRVKDDVDYYSSIDTTLKDGDLKSALQTLILNRTKVSYGNAWEAFEVIDLYLPVAPGEDDCPSGTIPDIYSTFCWTPEKGLETGGECGNYKHEGDCYNREHSWPKSWWGGFSEGNGAESDLFELYPSDGYGNGLRGNLPFGSVESGTEKYTSSNGCKIGECSGDTGDYTGSCFEPADYMKGDLSRTYFYLSTMYDGVWECCEEDAVNEARINTWEENILREWHNLDPVDDMEMKRNNIIYEQYQHNRNPYIDHPEFVDSIAGF